jgi:hypothetical protein
LHPIRKLGHATVGVPLGVIERTELSLLNASVLETYFSVPSDNSIRVIEILANMVVPKIPLWVPSRTRDTNVAKFMAYVNQKHNINLQTYEQLHKWSVDDKTSSYFWKDAYVWLELSPKGTEDVGRVLNSQVS